MDGQDGRRPAADDHGCDDLGRETAVRREHPPEGGVVEGDGAVVLNHLSTLHHLQHHGLRRQVHGNLVPERADTGRDRLLHHRKRRGAGEVAAQRDPARAGGHEQLLHDRPEP